jgi:hypothetical protein
LTERQILTTFSVQAVARCQTRFVIHQFEWQRDAFLNHDFHILSVGNGSATDKCGHWGCGTVSKNIVSVGGGTEYQLIGTGEPHGTIQFLGAFDTLTWRSLTPEYWNGITVGVQGPAVEVFPDATPVPEPATLLLLGSGLVRVVSRARRRKTA